MSRRFKGSKEPLKKGFLLIELVAGIALLGLCGLLYAHMQGMLAQSVSQGELALKAVTELDMAIQALEMNQKIAANKSQEKGPYTIDYSDLSVPSIVQSGLSTTSYFKLVEVTISWSTIVGNKQSISGVAGIMV